MKLSDEGLWKVIFELEDHWCGLGAEGMWTKPLGNDLYEIQNVPFYSYDVDYMDVVHATSADPKTWPTFRKLVKQSGHRTLRVFFSDDDAKAHDRFLKRLNKLHAYYENANDRLYALDLEPEAPLQEIIKILDKAEKDGVLGYETTRDKRKRPLAR